VINLHERLSEFSYGYGVTREVENLLRSAGIRATPFLPSLIHEKDVGFDVAFRARGTVIMLQFKLGESLYRFRNRPPFRGIPKLDRPFWRFHVNTAEANGQFETLLKAERDGADAYYAAPLLVDWSQYLSAYQAARVLKQSILIRPSAIRTAVDRSRAPDGNHRIVYDDDRTYVCSEPEALERAQPTTIAEQVRARLSEGPQLSDSIRRLFRGLDEHHAIRRTADLGRDHDSPVGETDEAEIREQGNRLRRQRLELLRSRAKTEDDAFAAALGLEVWSLGVQLIFATAD
jgi:hypothetical protein